MTNLYNTGRPVTIAPHGMVTSPTAVGASWIMRANPRNRRGLSRHVRPQPEFSRGLGTPGAADSSPSAAAPGGTNHISRSTSTYFSGHDERAAATTESSRSAVDALGDSSPKTPRTTPDHANSFPFVLGLRHRDGRSDTRIRSALTRPDTADRATRPPRIRRWC